MFFIMSYIDKQLFNNHSIIEKCTLKNKYETVVMIDTELNDYEFINPIIAHKVCETLQLKFVELIKYQIAKKYNEKKKVLITHVIYLKIIIDSHLKNLTSLMIILFANHLIILNWLGLIKHEIIIDVVVALSEKIVMK